MAKISQLPPLVTADPAITVPVVHEGATMRAPLALLVDGSIGPLVERGETAAARAEAARDAALQSPAFPDLAAGIAATAQGGIFAVVAAGTNLIRWYRRTAGGADAIGDQLSAVGARALAALAERVRGIRPVLMRAFGPSPDDPGLGWHFVASDIINGCRVQSTDPTNTSLWRPLTGAYYPHCWPRDMAMTMEQAPAFFSGVEVANAFRWVAARVNLPLVEFGQHQDRFGTPCDRYKRYVQDDFWVPDHIALDGHPLYYPGAENFGQLAPNTYGHRASLDGGPMLVQMAWVHHAKTGSVDLYQDHRALLWGVLDSLPRDVATGLIAVDPAKPCVSWGFIDTVLLTGGCAFVSVLTAIAYRQLACMALAARDFDGASAALDAADAICAGLASLYRSVSLAGTPAGLLLASNGGESPDQLDLWASSLASAGQLIPEEMQQGVAMAIAAYFLSPPIGGVNQVFTGGGLRHVPVSNDFEAGQRMWATSIFGTPFDPVGYGEYQNGAFWLTPVAWAIETVGRYHPFVAQRMRQLIIARYNLETRTQSEGQYIFPTEWVAQDATDPKFGAIRYMTSIAALVSIPGNRSGPSLSGCTTRLTISARQPLPPMQFAWIRYDRAVVDELGGFEPTQNGIRVAVPGKYRVAFTVMLDRRGDGLPVGTHDAAIYVNGAQRRGRGPLYVGSDIETQVDMTATVMLDKGDLVQGWCRRYEAGAGGVALGTLTLPGIDDQYSYLELTYIGP